MLVFVALAVASANAQQQVLQTSGGDTKSAAVSSASTNRLLSLLPEGTPTNQDSIAIGKELRLGPTEFKLLHFFMTHPERVYSRMQLLDQVWGDHVFVEERTVDVHIRRLRQALEPTGHDGLIETVRGAGYRLHA